MKPRESYEFFMSATLRVTSDVCLRSKSPIDAGGLQTNVKYTEITIRIPDDLASRMTASDGDLSRRVFEALALEEFKSGRIVKPELRRLLGFGTRYRLDGLLNLTTCMKSPPWKILSWIAKS
jgi:hypothetical protein